jgi:hypothetical protein
MQSVLFLDLSFYFWVTPWFASLFWDFFVFFDHFLDGFLDVLEMLTSI